MKIKDLYKITNKSIINAGARYTPAIDTNAPNIQMAELLGIFSGLETGKNFSTLINSKINGLEKRWRQDKYSFGKLFTKVKQNPDLLIKELELLYHCKPNEGKEIINKIKKTLNFCIKRVSNRSTKIYEELTLLRDQNKESNELNNQSIIVRRFLSTLNELSDFLDSKTCKLIDNNSCILMGEWGQGKTHFLCDYAKQRLHNNYPALILLAKEFLSKNPIEEISSSLSFKNIENLLKKLNQLGLKAKSRAILIIDGINEADHDGWRKDIPKLKKLVKNYPYVGLVLSFRKPFHEFIIPSVAVRNGFITIPHNGFTDIEFDAQKEFFKCYNIPLPQVPLLSDEFSRPLVLKMICLSLKNLSQENKKKGIVGIASGQKGMTKILEDFIKHIGKIDIEKKLGLPVGNFCWPLIKGLKTASKEHKYTGIVPLMVYQMESYISIADCKKIINLHLSQDKKIKCNEVYNALKSSGILMEDYIYWPEKDGGSKIIVRLPYERFSDHLIARELLQIHFPEKRGCTQLKIKALFRKNKPLGKIFALDEIILNRFHLPGWAEALIVEFPERIKGYFPGKERELFFYLPQFKYKAQEYRKPFISGLFWRNPTSFCKGTDSLIDFYLNPANKTGGLYYDILDALVSLATKPKHPSSAKRLYNFLSKKNMAERDIFWSEFLRKYYYSPSIERILHWIENQDVSNFDNEYTESYIIILSLLLTSNVRRLRDRATKCLVKLGEQNPKVLLAHTLKTLEFNDPYVSERMLAASYGITMAFWADKTKKEFRKELYKFTKRLVMKIFIPKAPYGTHHTLKQDYALGIIKLAIRINRRCVASKFLKYLNPPFNQIKTPFSNYEEIKDIDFAEKLGSAIQMDFGNYTIGRLIQNRGNYDYENNDFQEVTKQIECRIIDLGYNTEIFKEIDYEIGRNSWSESRAADGSNKTDRYGKKYSWIAYFEMYGYRRAKNLLNRERTGDADIDPSFPQAPQKWFPILPELFIKKYRSEAGWLKNGPTPDYKHLISLDEINGVKGPWILLNGYINQVNKDAKEVFSFLRGLFIQNENIDKFKEKFLSKPYSDHSHFPDIGQDHYVFAGEIPWSNNFASYYRKKNGKTKRHIEEAFYEYQQIKKKRKPGTTINPFALLEKGINHKKYEIVYKKIPGIKIEIPAFAYSWESNNSELNQEKGFQFPAPSICEFLDLRMIGHQPDLYDKYGKLATIFRKDNNNSWLPGFNFLYLRKDLLESYLKYTNQRIIYAIWGERDFYYEKKEAIINKNKLHKIYQKNLNNHKTLLCWDKNYIKIKEYTDT